jgi:electron transfer flavoprotein beta subunit
VIVLVPIKRVPDPYERVRVSNDGTLSLEDVKWVINPFDEIALEEAVRQREGGATLEIVAVSIGAPECETTLRTALAMGADRAILVEHEEALEPLGVATLLQALCTRESAGLVLMGKQAIDDDYNQTGQLLAARLGVPQATFASKLTLEPGHAVVVREVDAGRETVRVTLPAVVTVDLRLNEPRYVALPAILKARNKPLERIPSDVLASVPESRIEILELLSPPTRTAGKKVASVDALLNALREEAHVV